MPTFDDASQAAGHPEAAEEPTRDSQTLSQIVKLNAEVSEARAKHERLHTAAKAAKGVLEERQDKLNDFIAGLTEEYPLFEQKAEGAEATEPAEDWRAVLIADLRDESEEPLPPGVLQALAENAPPLVNLGQLADWSKSGKNLTDVKGIGDAKAEQIQDMLEHFWNQRAIDDPTNQEILDGVKEAEAAQAAEASEEDPYAWRMISVLDLGLAHHTEGVLKRHDIATVGELVALGAHAADWIEDAEKIDIAEGLARFRQCRSNADIEEFDAACAEAAKKEPAAEPARPKRGRRSKVSA